MKRINYLVFGACLLLSGCSLDVEDTPTIQTQDPKLEKESTVINLTESEVQTINICNELGFDLLRQLSLQENNNITLSPLSVLNVLAISANGASADTRSNLLGLFNLAGDKQEGLTDLNNTCHKLLSELPCLSNGIFLDMTNSFWTASDKVNPSFENSLSYFFNGEVIHKDPLGLKGMKEINEWVAYQTRNRITDFLDKPIYSNHVILNTLYFDGMWGEAFDPDFSYKKDFKNFDGSTAKVDFMNDFREASVATRDSWLALDLPFANGTYSATFITSVSDGKLPEISLDIWNGLIQDAKEEFVSISLPKFEVKGGENLSETIETIHPGSLENTLFSNFLLTKDPLRLINLFHTVYFSLSEQGAICASGSLADFEVAPSPGQEVKACFDKPFYFFVHEKQSGSIIFIAKINKL